MRYSPSLACASQLNMLADIKELEKAGVDMLHIDIMDGNYVPNICLNPDLCGELKAAFPKMELDVHLMVNRPMDYIARFADMGAEWLTFHSDATSFSRRAISQIKAAGMKAGIALNPSQPVSGLLPFIDELDMVLLMAIEPGFSGQQFMEDSYARLEELKKIREERDLKFLINVDGGINAPIGKQCMNRGADILVLGVFACFNQNKSISLACKAFDEELKR